MNAIDSAREPRRPRRTPLLIGLTVALASVGAGGAWAQTPDPSAEPAAALDEFAAPAPAAGGTDASEPAADPAGEAPAGDAGEPSAEKEKSARRAPKLELKLEEAKPKKVFWVGWRKAVFHYEVGGNKKVDLVIEVVKSKSGADQMVRRYREPNREGGKEYELKWDGKRSNGDSIKKGTFYFRVSEAGGRRLSRKNADGNRSFKVFPAIFPVDGRHDYWDGFGAGRNHAGQDVGASCGTPLRAAEPGTVSTKAYDGGGYGYYVVIDVKGSSRQELYSHLRAKATVRQGEHVETGQRIGKVGESGNAVGCHLHFEYRPNGSPSPKVTSKLRGWDKYS